VIAVHEHHVTRLDSGAGPGADRHAHVGRGGRRRVIHAVADHCDALPRTPQLLDLPCLLIRRYLFVGFAQ
jgi:hypothetical protein